MSMSPHNPPASPAQIAHDLRMQAKALQGRHLSGHMMDGLCRSLNRGAATIEHLLKRITDIEAER
ncbi:MAG: hypothetical protein Q4G22_04730 [Paracoccus sp. (in: a-proteobacteria)]|uniref:hypothetical protein n=1 Tax=Paracoccus sp. TaxID=267 RepID=UPI0026DF6F85|nr:hypothetical protein [Paracoccus sp. (in: a-proteobacteria)]MDO5631124.1 hypothetical protein [Paracoccus sp. (in: a-proteobacteria)]